MSLHSPQLLSHVLRLFALHAQVDKRKRDTDNSGGDDKKRGATQHRRLQDAIRSLRLEMEASDETPLSVLARYTRALDELADLLDEHSSVEMFALPGMYFRLQVGVRHEKRPAASLGRELWAVLFPFKSHVFGNRVRFYVTLLRQSWLKTDFDNLYAKDALRPSFDDEKANVSETLSQAIEQLHALVLTEARKQGAVPVQLLSVGMRFVLEVPQHLARSDDNDVSSDEDSGDDDETIALQFESQRALDFGASELTEKIDEELRTKLDDVRAGLQDVELFHRLVFVAKQLVDTLSLRYAAAAQANVDELVRSFAIVIMSKARAVHDVVLTLEPDDTRRLVLVVSRRVDDNTLKREAELSAVSIRSALIEHTSFLTGHFLFQLLGWPEIAVGATLMESELIQPRYHYLRFEELLHSNDNMLPRVDYLRDQLAAALGELVELDGELEVEVASARSALDERESEVTYLVRNDSANDELIERIVESAIADDVDDDRFEGTITLRLRTSDHERLELHWGRRPSLRRTGEAYVARNRRLARLLRARGDEIDLSDNDDDDDVTGLSSGGSDGSRPILSPPPTPGRGSEREIDDAPATPVSGRVQSLPQTPRHETLDDSAEFARRIEAAKDEPRFRDARLVQLFAPCTVFEGESETRPVDDPLALQQWLAQRALGAVSQTFGTELCAWFTRSVVSNNDVFASPGNRYADAAASVALSILRRLDAFVAIALDGVRRVDAAQLAQLLVAFAARSRELRADDSLADIDVAFANEFDRLVERLTLGQLAEYVRDAGQLTQRLAALLHSGEVARVRIDVSLRRADQAAAPRWNEFRVLPASMFRESPRVPPNDERLADFAIDVSDVTRDNAVSKLVAFSHRFPFVGGEFTARYDDYSFVYNGFRFYSMNHVLFAARFMATPTLFHVIANRVYPPGIEPAELASSEVRRLVDTIGAVHASIERVSADKARTVHERARLSKARLALIYHDAFMARARHSKPWLELARQTFAWIEAELHRDGECAYERLHVPRRAFLLEDASTHRSKSVIDSFATGTDSPLVANAAIALRYEMASAPQQFRFERLALHTHTRAHDTMRARVFLSVRTADEIVGSVLFTSTDVQLPATLIAPGATHAERIAWPNDTGRNYFVERRRELGRALKGLRQPESRDESRFLVSFNMDSLEPGTHTPYFVKNRHDRAYLGKLDETAHGMPLAHLEVRYVSPNASTSTPAVQFPLLHLCMTLLSHDDAVEPYPSVFGTSRYEVRRLEAGVNRWSVVFRTHDDDDTEPIVLHALVERAQQTLVFSDFYCRLRGNALLAHSDVANGVVPVDDTEDGDATSAPSDDALGDGLGYGGFASESPAASQRITESVSMLSGTPNKALVGKANGEWQAISVDESDEAQEHVSTEVSIACLEEAVDMALDDERAKQGERRIALEAAGQRFREARRQRSAARSVVSGLYANDSVRAMHVSVGFAGRAPFDRVEERLRALEARANDAEMMQLGGDVAKDLRTLIADSSERTSARLARLRLELGRSPKSSTGRDDDVVEFVTPCVSFVWPFQSGDQLAPADDNDKLGKYAQQTLRFERARQQRLALGDGARRAEESLFLDDAPKSCRFEFEGKQFETVAQCLVYLFVDALRLRLDVSRSRAALAGIEQLEALLGKILANTTTQATFDALAASKRVLAAHKLKTALEDDKLSALFDRVAGAMTARIRANEHLFADWCAFRERVFSSSVVKLDYRTSFSSVATVGSGFSDARFHKFFFRLRNNEIDASVPRTAAKERLSLSAKSAHHHSPQRAHWSRILRFFAEHRATQRGVEVASALRVDIHRRLAYVFGDTTQGKLDAANLSAYLSVLSESSSEIDVHPRVKALGCAKVGSALAAYVDVKFVAGSNHRTRFVFYKDETQTTTGELVQLVAMVHNHPFDAPPSPDIPHSITFTDALLPLGLAAKIFTDITQNTRYTSSVENGTTTLTSDQRKRVPLVSYASGMAYVVRKMLYELDCGDLGGSSDDGDDDDDTVPMPNEDDDESIPSSLGGSRDGDDDNKDDESAPSLDAYRAFVEAESRASASPFLAVSFAAAAGERLARLLTVHESVRMLQSSSSPLGGLLIMSAFTSDKPEPHVFSAGLQVALRPDDNVARRDVDNRITFDAVFRADDNEARGQATTSDFIVGALDVQRLGSFSAQLGARESFCVVVEPANGRVTFEASGGSQVRIRFAPLAMARGGWLLAPEGQPIGESSGARTKRVVALLLEVRAEMQRNAERLALDDDPDADVEDKLVVSVVDQDRRRDRVDPSAPDIPLRLAWHGGDGGRDELLLRAHNEPGVGIALTLGREGARTVGGEPLSEALLGVLGSECRLSLAHADKLPRAFFVSLVALRALLERGPLDAESTRVTLAEAGVHSNVNARFESDDGLFVLNYSAAISPAAQ